MSKSPVSDAYNKAKAWYQSKTIIGIIIAAVATLLQAFAPKLGLDLVGVVDELQNADEIATNLDNVWVTLSQTFGLVLALWGRIKAKTGIKITVKYKKFLSKRVGFINPFFVHL